MEQGEAAVGDSGERLFRQIFETCALGMAVVSPEGRPLYTNAALERFLGYSRAELRQMSFPEFTHSEDIEVDWSLYAELLAGERSHYRIDKRYLHKNGSVIWGRLTVWKVDGDPPQVIGMVEDLTNARALAAQQARLVWTLGERVKELQTLHRIARLLNQNLTVVELLTQVANMLPPGFQYPTETHAKLSYGAFSVNTPGYADTACQITSRFELADGSELRITLDMGPKWTDPATAFLTEEQALIDSVADFLGGALDTRSAQ
jgi:PAS domain S-box-containing protein